VSTADRRPALLNRLSAGDRVILALVLGGWGAFVAYFAMASHPQHVAKDFSYPWRAARALLMGQDPYRLFHGGGGTYPFNIFYYPLPAAIVAIPVAPLRPAIAGAVFVGVSAALLGWGVLRDCPYRLPLFLSAPFIQSAILGQWSPILMAAALLPTLQFVLAAKPTIGLAAWLYKPSWRGLIGGFVLVAISFVVLPDWFREWLGAAPSAVKYRGPATTLMGAFLLLGLLRWRRREGRLFVALSLVPQLPVFYDQLLLWLIPSNMARTFALTAASWVGYLGWYPHHTSSAQNELAVPWMVFTLYAPALVLLLLLPSRHSQEVEPTGSSLGASSPGSRVGST
jgi:hypothetical protein